MKKSQISVIYTNSLQRSPLLTLHLQRAILAALREEKIPVPVEINVLLTDDRTVQGLNRAYRGIDRPTDVLSFPAFSFTPGAFPQDTAPYTDKESGLLPLGDMAISLSRAREQAKQYGHSFGRELGYLAIHSVLHLLGYDHVDEGEMKRQMRRREEAIADSIGLRR